MSTSLPCLKEGSSKRASSTLLHHHNDKFDCNWGAPRARAGFFPEAFRGAAFGGLPPLLRRFTEPMDRLYSEKTSYFPSGQMDNSIRRPPLLVPSHYVPPLKIEPEPAMVALDLRICKQNQSISLSDFSMDILGEELSSSSPAKRTPSPLPPPLSFREPPPFEIPLRPETPFSAFPPEDCLQNLSPLERMKIIGAHHTRYRERKDLQERTARNSIGGGSCMDNKIRKIDYLSSETRNLIVLPSRTNDALVETQRASSPPPRDLEEENPRHVLLKRRLSIEGQPPPDVQEGPSSISVAPEQQHHLLSSEVPKKTKRGRPRKHVTKVPLPPLYVFLRNLIFNDAYNPRVICWVNERSGVFKVNRTGELAQTWGKMKRNRSEEMNYEKMSRAMRYHYGNEKQGRKGHLGMVKEKRLVYQFGELAINWKAHEIVLSKCKLHSLCRGSFCLWSKE